MLGPHLAGGRLSDIPPETCGLPGVTSFRALATTFAVPTIQATRVRCPECGATTAASGELVTCTYCGTQARVQRRTQVMQRPIPLPPSSRFVPVATQVRRTGGLWLVIGLVTVLPIVVGGAMCLVERSLGVVPTSSTGPAPPPSQPARARGWESSHPLLVDVDGDGIEDVIGVQREVTPDSMRLAALSGADGHVLWNTRRLGTYLELYRHVATLAGSTVLFFDATGAPDLDAYDARTGVKKWHAVPPEIVSAICGARADGKLTLVTKDEARFTLDLATGALNRQIRKPTVCPALPSTEPRRVVDFLRQGPHRNVQPPGMTNDAVVGGKGSWIIAGHKSPGTEIPMLAVLDDKEKLVWSTQVPGREPMKAKRYAPDRVAYDERTIAVGYERPDTDTAWLTAFDRATGRRLFEHEVAMGESPYWHIADIQIGTKMIYVMTNGSVRGFDRETGAPRWDSSTMPDP